MVFLLAPSLAGASLPESLSLSGYFVESPMLWQSAQTVGGSDNSVLNLIHLRQNLRWYPSSSITVGLELKERLLLGADADRLAEAIFAESANLPYFDWTASTAGDESYAEASIDRLWFDLAAGGLELRCGRQRIAWGTNLVWNPVDIFNPSSFLDFDNEEKPGTDAVRVQYYLGPASEVDVAWAPGRDSGRTSAAARFKINIWSCDVMLIGGRHAADEVVGLAWASSIGGAGFRGEALAGRPRTGADRKDRSYLNASASVDYAFPNTVYVQTSVLYEGRGTTGDAGGPRPISAYERGDLSPAKWSLFGEVAMDFTPLTHGDVSAIVNPYDRSFYVGPSIDWSATPNLDLTGTVFAFSGHGGTEYGNQSRIWMLRAKYSF